MCRRAGHISADSEDMLMIIGEIDCKRQGCDNFTYRIAPNLRTTLVDEFPHHRGTIRVVPINSYEKE